MRCRRVSRWLARPIWKIKQQLQRSGDVVRCCLTIRHNSPPSTERETPMASVLSFTLTIDPSVSGSLQDNFGVWEYAGATGKDASSGQTVKLIATKRYASSPGFQPSASMLTASVQFDGNASGVPAKNLTLQGVHDLTSKNIVETGSVSAASSELAEYIGGTFSFDAHDPQKLLLTIHPREGYSSRA
jgi:hypothetical protein